MNPLLILSWVLLVGLLTTIPVAFVEAIRLMHGWVNAKRRLWDVEATLALRIGQGADADGHKP